MKHPPILETERLRLRPFEISDSVRVMSLAGNLEVYRTTLNVPHPYEEGMAEKWISSHSLQFYNGNGVTLAITLQSDGLLIGAIGLGITKQHHRGELGYWIGVDFWRQGYCAETAIKMIEYGFKELKLHKITSRHFECNPASGRVMVKAGMVKEGKHIDEFFKDGRFHSDIVYGIVNSEQTHAPDAQLRADDA